MKPDAPAQTALKECFGKELSIIQESEKKLKLENGAEYLHKLRISVRKTRALLGHAKYVMPERTILKFNRKFKYLAQKTCKLRDLDVYLNTLNKYRFSAVDNPDEIQNALFNYVSENKIREEQELLVYLNSVEYKRLKEDWSKIIDNPESKYSRLKYANIPIEYVLERGIIKQYQKMFKQGNAIDIDTPYLKYHEFRKTCKKLRYLLEYFSDLHPKNKIKSVIKALKNIQDILGELQDYRIQIELLNSFINTRKNDNDYSDSELDSIELLISTLDRRSQKIKSLFPDYFNNLSCKFNKKSYRKLFHNYKNAIDYQS